MFGIITALPEEFRAMCSMLLDSHAQVVPGRGAGRQYVVGDLPAKDRGCHRIVLALLSDMGTTIAAVGATRMLEHFPSITSLIIVGIAGGVPDPTSTERQISLGDVAVSGREGVVQFDFKKEVPDRIIPRHPPRPPAASLLEGIRYFQADPDSIEAWRACLDRVAMQAKAPRPEAENPVRSEFYVGTIASSNTLVASAAVRNELRRRFGVIACEMEASGIADATWESEVGYLVVRGICDLADERKDDRWHAYAAQAAATFTYALLSKIPSADNDQIGQWLGRLDDSLRRKEIDESDYGCLWDLTTLASNRRYAPSMAPEAGGASRQDLERMWRNTEPAHLLPNAETNLRSARAARAQQIMASVTGNQPLCREIQGIRFTLIPPGISRLGVANTSCWYLCELPLTSDDWQRLLGAACFSMQDDALLTPRRLRANLVSVNRQLGGKHAIAIPSINQWRFVEDVSRGSGEDCCHPFRLCKVLGVVWQYCQDSNGNLVLHGGRVVGGSKSQNPPPVPVVSDLHAEEDWVLRPILV